MKVLAGITSLDEVERVLDLMNEVRSSQNETQETAKPQLIQTQSDTTQTGM
jgi:hypothetical protein